MSSGSFLSSIFRAVTYLFAHLMTPGPDRQSSPSWGLTQMIEEQVERAEDLPARPRWTTPTLRSIPAKSAESGFITGTELFTLLS
jgi:hypothetical protein